MKKLKLIILILILAVSELISAEPMLDSLSVEMPEIIMQNIEYDVDIMLFNGGKPVDYAGDISLNINGNEYVLHAERGSVTCTHVFEENQTFFIGCQDAFYEQYTKPIPLWFSIIPPLIAILFALIFKEVFSALFIGILSGTFVIYIYKGVGVFSAFFKGIFAIVDEYVLYALFERGHLAIIIFSMLIGATVSVITRNGGMQGIVNYIMRFARTAKSGQMATWLMGLSIFFDDYANTLVVGNTMRPITDKLRISRAKLAYIVDSTAAPIASIAFVTTWIGAELSYISDGISTLGLDTNPYQVFFHSLQYAFYPLLTIVFVFILIKSGRDYGPMFKFEKEARLMGVVKTEESEITENELRGPDPDSKRKPRAFNALIPIAIIIFGTIAGLLYTGWDVSTWQNHDLGFASKLSQTIGQADSYKALMWSSLGGMLTAVVLSLVQKLMNLKQSADSMIRGFKTMLTAIIILTLAWALALLTEHLHTAGFISNILSEAAVHPGFLPAITFVVSALVAFSTGTSWGTMAIMYPLILPATWLVCMEYGMDNTQAMSIFNNVVSTVIAGSVLGDHCSPISDTTILSSLASSCNHIQHVRTQMPYALSVGAVAIVVGTIPAGFGIPVYVSFPIAIILLFLIIRIFGKKTLEQLSPK
jgi:Na+/H+ antiporter NhaC